jgi:hypothetical protein
MFEKEIDFLETLKDIPNTPEEDINNMIFNLENFDVFDYFRTLDDIDILEIILTLIEKMENNEKEKAKKAIENDDGFYNSELKKAENNIDILNKIYNMITYELY